MTTKTLGASVSASREAWITEFGDRFDEEELRKWTKAYLTSYYETNRVPVKPGLYGLLDYLRETGRKLAVASSSPQWEVNHHLTDAGVLRYFDVIVCGDMVKKSKPSPEIYLAACEKLREKPADCFALEDSKNGLLSALAAGCKAIMVPDLWPPDEETKKRVFRIFSDLSEVQSFFESLDNPG